MLFNDTSLVFMAVAAFGAVAAYEAFTRGKAWRLVIAMFGFATLAVISHWLS